VSQKNSQIWQAGVSTSTDKFLINFSKQHQQTFKYDTRIQLSLFLHFYLLYLLLNSCDKMMRHRRLAAALTDTWTTISHHRRIKDLKLTATDYQSNLKSKKQKKNRKYFCRRTAWSWQCDWVPATRLTWTIVSNLHPAATVIYNKAYVAHT